MAFHPHQSAHATPTKEKEAAFTPGLTTKWHTSLSPNARTPNSHKKKPSVSMEDIIYVSRAELDKELRTFISLFISRNLIKESETSQYIEYLKKGINNVAFDSSQMENFNDTTRSPGSRKISGPQMAEAHLKLRNYQLERDRNAYEDKLMKHGKHVSDLEEQISKLIEEYQTVHEGKTELEAKLEDYNAQMAQFEKLNANLKMTSEEALRKNLSMKKDLDSIQKELEKQVTRGMAYEKESERLKVKVKEFEEQAKKSNGLKAKIEFLQDQIKEMEEEKLKNVNLKQEVEKRDRQLEEYIKQAIDLGKDNELLHDQVVEMETELKKKEASTKLRSETFEKQIAALEEQVKKNVGLKRDIEVHQMKIEELEMKAKKEIDRKNEEVEKLKKIVEKVEVKANEVKEDLSFKEEETKELRERIKELEEQTERDSELKIELIVKQKKLDEVVKQLELEREEREEMTHEMNEQIAKLEEQTQKIVEQEKQIKALEKKTVEKEEQLKKETRLKNDVVQKQVAEIEQHVKKDNEKKQEIYFLKQKTIELEEQTKKESSILKSQLEELEATNVVLEEQAQKCIELEKEVEKQNEQIEGLLEQIEGENGFKKEIEALQENIVELEGQVKAETEAKEVLNSRVIELEEQVQKEAEEKAILEIHVKEDKETQELLNNRIAGLEKQIEKADDLETHLRGQIFELEEQTRQDNITQENLNHHIVELEKQVKRDEGLKKEIEIQQARIIQLETQTITDAGLKEEMISLHKTVSELKEQVKRDMELKDEVKVLQKHIEQLETQVAQETEAKKGFEVESKQSQDHVIALQSQVEKDKQEVEKLRGQIQELTAVQQKESEVRVTLVTELKERVQKDSELKEELETLQKHTSKLEKQVEADAGLKEHIQELNAKVLALEDQAQKDAELKTNLQAQNLQLKQELSEDLDLKQMLNRHIAELAEQVKKDAGLKVEMENQQDRISQLEAQVTSDAGLKQEILNLHKTILERDQEVTREKGLKVELESRLSELERELERVSGIKEELYHKSTELTGQVKNERDLNGQIEKELRAQVASLNTKIVELENKTKEDSVRLEGAQGYISQLEVQVAKDAGLKKELVTIHERIAELKEQNNKAAESTKHVETMQQLILDLQSEVDGLRQKNSELIEQTRRDAGLNEAVEMLQARIFELEGQQGGQPRERTVDFIYGADRMSTPKEKKRLSGNYLPKDSNSKVVDMERVSTPQEKVKLNAYSITRESNVKVLENKKEQLLKEIGGMIDSIHLDKDSEKSYTHDDINRILYENVHLTHEVKERDTLIELLKVEGQNLMQDIQETQAALEGLKTKQASEIEQLRLAYEEREQQILRELKVDPHQVQQTQLNSSLLKGLKPDLPQINVLKASPINKHARNISDGDIWEPAGFLTSPLYSKQVSRENLMEIDENCQSYCSMSYYDSWKKQIEDYRTANVLLQKKVENYYMQIEELNGALKMANENLDTMQNRCITLQRELQNKANLETLVQSLLNLINNLENKIERLVEENVALQKTSQDNVVTITTLRNHLEDETHRANEQATVRVPKLEVQEEIEEDRNGMATTKWRESNALEKEFLRKEYEEKMGKLIEEKEMELEEERIRSKSHVDRYNAHLDVLGKKVQALVTVNEGLGRDLEMLKAEFRDYKIVVVSILQEASKCVENLRTYDVDIQNLLIVLSENGTKKGADVLRLREYYEMLRRDIADASKLLEERKLLV